MHALEHARRGSSGPVEQRPFTEFSIVHADRGGGLRLAVDLGDEVKLARPSRRSSTSSAQPVEQLDAPHDGFVLRAMRLGSIATGAEVVWIAS